LKRGELLGRSAKIRGKPLSKDRKGGRRGRKEKRKKLKGKGGNEEFLSIG